MSAGASSRRSGSKLGDLAIIGVMIIALFAGLIWLTGQGGTPDTPESAGSSLSAGARGALALYRWLEKAGFQVERTQGGQQFPPDVDTLFMINPNGDFPEGQAGSVRRWVEEGHTLVLALGGRAGDLSTELGGEHPMLRELGVDVAVSAGYSSTVPLSQPFFNRPPLGNVDLPGSLSLDVPLSNTVVLASAKSDNGSRLPLAAVMKLGGGRVFLLAGDYPLSNEGIRQESNWALVYNMVQMSGGKRVAFDEAHHGQSVGGDLIALVTNNAWGWALIYGVLAIAAYVFWSARRLGPPVPVRKADQRRPTAEYVNSVAALFRRARKPGYAAERYLQYFKRTLSRHAELDPFLTDARFVQALAERGRHSFNQEEMLHAIERLRRLEGNATGGESFEMATLKAIREAEKVRREALGLEVSI